MNTNYARAQAAAYWQRKRNRAAVVVDDNAAPAWGTITFSVNPSNSQTATIAGTVITFGSTVVIGASLAETLSNVLDHLDAHPISAAHVSVSGNGLLIQSNNPADTTVTLAASHGTVSHGTLQKQQINARVAL